MNDGYHKIFEVLTIEHAYLKNLFIKYLNSTNDESCNLIQLKLANEICANFTIHSKFETELLFPAIAKNIKKNIEARNLISDALIFDVLARHKHIEYSIMKINHSKKFSKLFDARIMVLSDHVDELIEIEENKIFEVAKKLTLEI